MTYAANVAEGDLADSGASNTHAKALRGKAAEEGCDVIVVSAQVRGAQAALGCPAGWGAGCYRHNTSVSDCVLRLVRLCMVRVLYIRLSTGTGPWSAC